MQRLHCSLAHMSCFGNATCSMSTPLTRCQIATESDLEKEELAPPELPCRFCAQLNAQCLSGDIKQQMLGLATDETFSNQLNPLSHGHRLLHLPAHDKALQLQPCVRLNMCSKQNYLHLKCKLRQRRGRHVSCTNKKPGA